MRPTPTVRSPAAKHYYLLLAQIKKKKTLQTESTIFYFSTIITSPRFNGAKISIYKPKGGQKPNLCVAVAHSANPSSDLTGHT